MLHYLLKIFFEMSVVIIKSYIYIFNLLFSVGGTNLTWLLL